MRFTDETKFRLYTSDGRNLVWRRTGALLLKPICHQKCRLDVGSAMMLAGILLTPNRELKRLPGERENLKDSRVRGLLPTATFNNV